VSDRVYDHPTRQADITIDVRPRASVSSFPAGRNRRRIPVGADMGWETAGVVFVADDLGAWLVGLLADAGRKKLTTWVLGSEQA
jgi:hypothetical protein